MDAMGRLFLLAFVAISAVHRINGTCTFPTFYTDHKWFVSYTESSGTDQNIRTYSSASINEGELGGIEDKDSYDCLSSVEDPNFLFPGSRYFYITEMKGKVKCNRDFLEYTEDVIIHGEIEVDSSVDAIACSLKDFDTVTKQIFIKSSIVADPSSISGICPFAKSVYQTSYVDQSGTSFCVGDMSSLSPLNSHMVINSCAATGPFDYDNPVNSRYVECLALMDGGFIDDTSVPVLIIVSPRVDDSNRVDIYCARYASQFDIIKLSVNAESDKEAFCHPGVSSSTSGGTNIAFTFDKSSVIMPSTLGPTTPSTTESTTPSTTEPTTPTTAEPTTQTTTIVTLPTTPKPTTPSTVQTSTSTARSTVQTSTSTARSTVQTSTSTARSTQTGRSTHWSTTLSSTSPTSMSPTSVVTGSPAPYADVMQHVQVCFQNNYQTHIGSTTDVGAYSQHIANQIADLLSFNTGRITSAHIQKGPVNDNIVFTFDLAPDASGTEPEVGKIVEKVEHVMDDPDTVIYGLNGEALELCSSSDLYFWADHSPCATRKCGDWPTTNMTWKEAGGRCWILQGIFQCECTDDFGGDFCLTAVSDHISQRTIIVIIVVIVIAVILITLICVFLCARYLNGGSAEDDDLIIYEDDEGGDSTLKSVYSTLSRGKATAYNDQSFQSDGPVIMETLSLGKGSRYR